MAWNGENRGYRVDRALLEQKPTEEILRILDEDRGDYTQEAITILEDILKSRGITVDSDDDAPDGTYSERVLIRSASDAVPVMNDVLNGVLQGTIDPDVGEAAAHIVMCILQALDQVMLRGQGEGT